MSDDSAQKDIQGIDRKVFEQFEQIRIMGLTNMFDGQVVKEIADIMHLDEFSEYVTDEDRQDRVDVKKYSQVLSLYPIWKKAAMSNILGIGLEDEDEDDEED